MNVLLLADTHLGEGQAARLIAKLSGHLEAADVIIHAGDVVDGSVLTALEEFAPVRAVHGNNDRNMILAVISTQRPRDRPRSAGEM